MTAASGCAWRNRPDPPSVAVELGGAATAMPRDRLRVATFNVAMQSADVIAGALRASFALRDADVILLQEIEAHADEGGSRAGQVARLLGMAYAYAPAFTCEHGGSHGVAVLSRHPLSGARVIELPRRDVRYNSRRRVALEATVHTARRSMRVYAVHLDLRQRSRDREAQLGPVLDRARRQDRPALIGGDFNTTPFTWLWRVVPIPGGHHGRKLEAFARRRGFDTPLTASGPTSPWLSMRLDGLYTRRLRVIASGVDDSVRISDHLPVWADVSWN